MKMPARKMYTKSLVINRDSPLIAKATGLTVSLVTLDLLPSALHKPYSEVYLPSN